MYERDVFLYYLYSIANKSFVIATIITFIYT